MTDKARLRLAEVSTSSQMDWGGGKELRKQVHLSKLVDKKRGATAEVRSLGLGKNAPSNPGGGTRYWSGPQEKKKGRGKDVGPSLRVKKGVATPLIG